MPLDTSKLPSTKARVSSSLSIMVKNPTNGQWMRIGAVQKLSRGVSKRTQRRREFDSDIPGVTVELIPNPTDTITLTIERAILYKANMLEAFGFDKVEDLVENNIPVTIREYAKVPTGIPATNAGLAGVKDKIYEYQDCYFTSNPIEYNLTRDILMIQTCTLDVTRIKTIS